MAQSAGIGKFARFRTLLGRHRAKGLEAIYALRDCGIIDQ